MAVNQQLDELFIEKNLHRCCSFWWLQRQKTELILHSFPVLEKRSVVSPLVLFLFRTITTITRNATKIAAMMTETHQKSAKKHENI